MKSFVKTIKNEFWELLDKWNIFWFDFSNLKNISLLRLLFCGTLFVFYFLRLIDFEFSFSENAILSSYFAQNIMPDFYKPYIVIFPYLENWLYVLHILFLIFILVRAVGIGGRTLSVILFLLHTIFIQRNMSIVYGADYVAGLWLFYLMFLDSDKYFSLRNRIFSKKVRKEEGLFLKSLHSTGARLFQLQVVAMYMYGGFEKLKGSSWWSGEAIWYVINNGQLVTTDLGFLAHFPNLLAIGTFLIVIWEVYFAALIWIKKWQKYILSFGILMHLLIGVFMNLPFFSAFMIFSYLLFLTDWKFWKK